MQNGENLSISYNDKNYTLKQLMEDENEFSKSLELPEEFNSNSRSFELEWLGDFGYIIALDKFKNLYNLLATARFTLIQAHQKLHKSPISWSSGYKGQLWLRSQYLKNAIIWYNSCNDYFLQIIWFAFDFTDPNKLKDRVTYEEVLEKECRWKNLNDRLKKRNAEINIKLLLEKIAAFNENPHIQSTRTLSNALKHRSNIAIKDLDLPPNFILRSELGFDSEAVRNSMLDVDQTIDIIQQTHLTVIKFSKFLFEFIDFQKPFENDKQGESPLNHCKEKSTYKKFYMS